MLDSAKIRREVVRLYDKDPQNWNVLVGKDRAGFYDVLISHGTEAWQMKEYQVNPYKFVGLGSRLPNALPRPLTGVESPFGLRPVNLDTIKEITTVMDDPRAMSELASKLLAEKPITSREAVESPAVLQGPIFHSRNPLDTLSTSHSRLDARMRRELQELVNRKFRHTVTPYI